MHFLASTESDAVSSDISNAFGQALKMTRENKLCCHLPQGMIEAGFDVDPRQLRMAETEVYGLISGPSRL
eukprot:11007896-Karenia_brevis.AAC.1